MGVSTAFFSYSRQDSEFALRLASDLRAAGANVWIDQLDIEIGQAWDHAIQSAINSCSIFIVVLSPHGIASSNVSDELSFALSQKKRIIPVVYRDCEIPLLLRRLHFIDFRTDYPESLRWLITALNVVLPGLNRKKRSAVRVFCSYSHEDEKLKKRLEQHLSPLVRQEIIEVWSDLRIDPGAAWENEIGRNLDSADMVLLLVSPSFVSSPYCWGKELGRALARHEKGECLVVSHNPPSGRLGQCTVR